MTRAATGSAVARIRPALVGALAGILGGLYTVALLYKVSGDASRFVHAAPPWTDPARTPPSLTVGAAGTGFDGQFFYRIAVAPFSTAPVAGGVQFDIPALRAVRWAYGGLGYLFSAGQPGAVPWVLVIVSLLAMVAAGWIGGHLARDVGRPPIAGLVFALWPGFAYSLSLDTAELVTGAFLLGGLLAIRRREVGAAAILLSLAVLTRDTAVVVAVGMVVAGLMGGSGSGSRAATDDAVRRVGLLAGGVAVLVFAAWQLLTWLRFGQLPVTASAGNNLTAPFVEMARAFGAAFPPRDTASALRLLSLLLVVLLLVGPAVAWRASRASLGEKSGWLLSGLVVVLLSAAVWAGATSFMRGATELGLLGTLVMLGARGRVLPLLSQLAGVVWLITAAAQLSKLG